MFVGLTFTDLSSACRRLVLRMTSRHPVQQLIDPLQLRGGI